MISGIIKKANLSADKQAVREMNQALAEYEASAGYVKPNDVEDVMQILADRGYNSTNWECLTEGYQVYWYKEDNRMILYNSGTNEIEYPDTYPADLFTDIRATADAADGSYKKGDVIRHFQIYNNNYKEAIKQDFTISTSFVEKGSSLSTFTSQSSLSTEQATSLSSALTGSSENSQKIQNALGISNSDVKINAASEVKTSSNTSAYAAMQVMNVTSGNTEPKLTSTGNVIPNLYYITITENSGADEHDIKQAQQDAAEYVYQLFVKVDSDETGAYDDITILFEGDTTIDCSDHEWHAVKYFQGYFGTTDPGHPVHINGAKLTTSTGYAETVSFDGSDGKYFVTGFFAAVYGQTTIENVVFENMTMEKPGSNFDMSLSAKKNSRNTIGIIGAVTNDPEYKVASDVTIRNVVVADTVTIHSAAGAGGLIGYVGGNADGTSLYNGTLTIENCHVSANIVCDQEHGGSTTTYGGAGGIVGFFCRCTEETSAAKITENVNNDNDGKNESYHILVKGTTFDGSITGCAYVGAFTSDIMNGDLEFVGENHFENATLSTTSTNAKAKAYITCRYAGGTIKYTDMPTIGSTYSAYDGLANLENKGTPAGNNDKY